MNDFLEDDPLLQGNQFKPVKLFERFGTQRVYYKGDAPEIEETPLEKESAAIAEERFKYYEDNYEPINAAFRDKVDEMDSEGAYKFAEGAARSSATKASSEARENVRTGLAAAGVNPNSGKSKMAMADMADTEGAIASDTSARALNSQSDEHATGVANVVAIGNNQATTAQQGLSSLANTSAAKAKQDAWADWNDKSAKNQAVGTVLGAGAQYVAGGGLGSAQASPGPAGTNATDYNSPDFKSWVNNQ
ncbi:hypothetical protein [uncultured Gilvimarinus sp.]|uniref:hypothetical protein n=1 Tax=uncultured Gilvimarinus sp. TaxID=1689143 RepID=UPI0030EB21AB|tara:strand:+ start:6767 stop:7510 length:744 start_codon:yes stop_codon:yes gene_type:complete